MITGEILRGITSFFKESAFCSEGKKYIDLGIKITVKAMIVIIAKNYELFPTRGKGLFQAFDLKSFNPVSMHWRRTLLLFRFHRQRNEAQVHTTHSGRGVI